MRIGIKEYVLVTTIQIHLLLETEVTNINHAQQPNKHKVRSSMYDHDSCAKAAAAKVEKHKQFFAIAL